MSGEWTLGVAEVVECITDFAVRLGHNERRLNALNVYPVADNDTGTNMVRSVGAVSAAIDAIGAVLDHVALTRAVEDAALDARGNSGLIVGQFLAGLVAPFDHTGLDVERGLAGAAAAARQAVAKPVEGTMLTVADVVASAARGGADSAGLADVARRAVDATPGQLEALGGRIDSGAAGLALFFDALAHVAATSPVPELIECNVGNEVWRRTGSAEGARRTVGHEIQFRVPTADVDADTVRSLLIGLGTDVVVAVATEEIAAHVHVDDAARATNVISAELEGKRGLKAISYEVEALVERDQP